MTSSKNERLLANITQRSAALVHQTSTPLAIARVNAELLQSKIELLQDAFKQLDAREEFVNELIAAPERILTQLNAVQASIHQHWQWVSNESPQISSQCYIESEKPLSTELMESIGKGARILVVEDEEVHRDVAKKVLADSYQVEFAESGEEAILCCERNCYDIVLLDIFLPGMSGTLAAERINRICGDKTAIIGLTNMPLGAHVSDANFNGYLQKPLVRAALEECLQSLSELTD